jgi:acyl carrier protein
MFENIKQFLVEELDVNAADITMETTLAGDLGINSIDLFDFLAVYEEKFNVKVKDEDLQSLVTVADLVKYAESAQN